MSESPTIIRCSSLPIFNDCARRIAANEMLRDEIVAGGIRLWPRKVGVGAAVGHAVDAAATLMLRGQIKGALAHPTLNGARDHAIAEFRKEIAGGCEYDKSVTPNAQVAEKQIIRMVEVYAFQVLPKVEPESVQRELFADVGDGFTLSGHWDVREVSGRLRDTKTGHDTWPAGPQFGGYALLGNAHGLPITSAVIDYIERVPLNKPQPPAVEIAYDVAQCRKEAARTIKRVKQQVLEFRASRDIEAIVANPMSQLCAAQWCSARNTEFCKSWKH
jgi:hypothetical protein